MTAYDNETGRPPLPPVPDLVTGEPRPPHAPLRETWASGVSDIHPASQPAQPAGEGPALEYFRQSRRWSLIHALSAGTILTIGCTVIYNGLGWVDFWFNWAVILGSAIFFFFFERVAVFSAGAQWFKYKKKWVRTYELKEVKVKVRGPGWLMLVLSDQDGRRVRVPLNQLVQNRELWDLVYNGILHSTCRRSVRTNRGARKLLKVSSQ